MPKVTFIKDGKETTVEFEQGKLPFQEHGLPESFLDVAMNFGIPLEHACGGSCACTTCHLFVREGMNNLSETEENEADRLDTAWRSEEHTSELQSRLHLVCCLLHGQKNTDRHERAIANTHSMSMRTC